MPQFENTDFTIDEIIAAWGDYYLNNGQNMQNLHTLPFEEFGTAEAGTILSTEQTVVREANVRFGEVLQPYQHEFTNKGSLKMLPVDIYLQHVKIDMKVLPNQLKGRWTDFLTANDLDPVSYPIIAYIIEQYLVKQAQEDLELSAIYKGVRATPDELVAGASVDVMDGLEKQLGILNAAGKMDYINTGAIAATPKDFVTQIEDFIKGIPEKYRYNMAMQLNMSRTLRDKFRQGQVEKYNMNYNQADNLTRVFLFENFTISGRASMMGKSKIWTTPKENLLIPVKGFSNAAAFDVQKVDRYVKFLSDWWIGAGFIQPELVFANELT